MKAGSTGYSKFVNSFVHGLSILECFSPAKYSLSLAEITKMTGISKTTAFRLVNTLHHLNYLKLDEHNKKYHLGPKVLSLGFSVLNSLEIIEIARPYLEGLAAKCGRTVDLAILDNTEMVYIDRVNVCDVRGLSISIGGRIPVYNTAVGRAVLSHLEKGRLDEILGTLLEDAQAVACIGENGDKLLKMLERARNKGYATNNQEYMEGLRAIAVPVFSGRGVDCALNLLVPSDSMSITKLAKDYAPTLIKTGKELSQALGYQGTLNRSEVPRGKLRQSPGSLAGSAR